MTSAKFSYIFQPGSKWNSPKSTHPSYPTRWATLYCNAWLAMLEPTKCRYGVKSILILLCCAGFFLQMRKEFNKFASARTTVAVSFDPVEEFRVSIQ